MDHTIHVILGIDSVLSKALKDWVNPKQIETALARIEKGINKIMATEVEVKAALDKIDAATTQIGTAVAAEATVVGTISTEVDALVLALQNAGVPQAILDQATALGTTAQASADALSALQPVLDAIATKGVGNPVPVPVPVP